MTQPLNVAPINAAIFMSAKCECSKDHEELLARLAKQFPKVKFFGVHSNADEQTAEFNQHFVAAHLPFPVYADPKSQLANVFRAAKTPHVFVFDSSGRVLYQGGITDSRHVASASTDYLEKALLEIESGKPVTISEARTLGCAIKRPL